MKQEKEIIKEKHIKEKNKQQKQPFNFKAWMREVLQSNSKKDVKPPKVEALFKLLIVECLKTQSQTVIKCHKLLKVNTFTVFSGFSTRIKNAIYSPKKEIDVVLSLVDSQDLTAEKIASFSNLLKQNSVNDFYIYSIKPTSADLNLIYLLKGGN